jgi:hypothetical protein
VHDSNDGEATTFRYYLAQLAYGSFPWTALVPAALWTACSGAFSTKVSRKHYLLVFFLLLWLTLAFSLFSFMGTKFHHYIFPALPPLALLVGLLLDRMVPTGSPWARPHFVAAIFGKRWADRMLANRRLVPVLAIKKEDLERECMAAVPWLLLLGLLLLALLGRDFTVQPPGEPQGQATLLHLFTYLYNRPWPETLDFRRVLWAITVAMGLATGLLLGPARWRSFALPALLLTAVLATGWEVNSYLVKLAPHWGQRATLAAYYGELPYRLERRKLL